MTLLFEVCEQTITRRDTKKVVADSRNYLRAKFIFSADWTGIKTAVFKRDDTVYNITLTNDECMVPYQVLGSGMFFVSVFCGDLITANAEYVEVDTSGYAESPPPELPDPLETYIKTYMGDKGVRFFSVEDEQLMFMANSGEMLPIQPGGKSAYEVAAENGFEGTIEEWLESLQGKGESAYEIAVGAGFEGTQEEWLDSLKADETRVAALENIVDGAKDILSAAQNCLGSWSLTELVEGVTAQLRINILAPSMMLSHWAVFIDDENTSGILPISESFTTAAIIFGSERVRIKFFDERDQQRQTFTAAMQTVFDRPGLKLGYLIEGSGE